MEVEKLFRDPWNPKSYEIIAWVNSDENWSDQDFDLSLATSGHELLLIELAESTNLPRHNFLIHVLYFMVGDSTYSENKKRQRYLKKTIRKTQSKLEEVEIWKRDSLQLLQGKMRFEYNYWCQYMFRNVEGKES